MLTSEIFPPERIKVGLEAEDKEEVFEELADLYCRTVQSGEREEIIAALKEREAKMSTGIQQGIALPHGRTNAVEKVSGVLGISRRGIDYEALDDKPVYLVFMILAPELDAEKHLQVLKRLAELLQNPQFYTDLLAQKDAQGAAGVIKKYEEIFNTLS